MKRKLVCVIRKEQVEAQPEELVRQKLLHQMVNDLGYPKGNLVVEKALKQMPHLSHLKAKIPDRRVDILCFAKDIHPELSFSPLLVIECKSVKITPKVINQVVGYNHFLKSPFIAVANEEEIKTGWVDPKTREYQFVPYLPSYSELVGSVSCKFAK